MTLLDGLALHTYPEDGQTHLRDQVTGQVGDVTVGTDQFGVDSFGRFARFDQEDDPAAWSAAQSQDADYTLMVKFRTPDLVDLLGGPVAVGLGPSNVGVIQAMAPGLLIPEHAVVGLVVYNGGGDTKFLVDEYEHNAAHVAVLRHRFVGGDYVDDLYLDGGLVDNESTAQTQAGAVSSFVEVGSVSLDTSIDVYAAAFWTRALDDDEVVSASNNPIDFPVPPSPTPTGNRMGGTGAIRRSPRPQ